MADDELLKEYYELSNRNDLSKKERKKIMNGIMHIINKKEFEEAKKNLVYELKVLFYKIFRR